MRCDRQELRRAVSARSLTGNRAARTVFVRGGGFMSGGARSSKNMSSEASKYLKFGSVTVLILVSLGYLAYTGVEDSKSYYVTIKELNGMGNEAYSKHLRVAGNVVPGSIKRCGTRVDFMLKENDLSLPVSYTGTEAPPDTFKDDSQALADGSFGRDGVFHAKQLQAKCASKYAPQPGATPAAGKSMSQNQGSQSSGSNGMAN